MLHFSKTGKEKEKVWMDYSGEIGCRSQAASKTGVNVRLASALDRIQHELDYFAV